MKRTNMSPWPDALTRLIPFPAITRWSLGWIPGGTWQPTEVPAQMWAVPMQMWAVSAQMWAGLTLRGLASAKVSGTHVKCQAMMWVEG